MVKEMLQKIDSFEENPLHQELLENKTEITRFSYNGSKKRTLKKKTSLSPNHFISSSKKAPNHGPIYFLQNLKKKNDSLGNIFLNIKERNYLLSQHFPKNRRNKQIIQRITKYIFINLNKFKKYLIL